MANGVSRGRAALEVHRILVHHCLRLEPDASTAAGRRPYFRVVAAESADEHLLRIERLLQAPPGPHRLDTAYEYTQCLAARQRQVETTVAGPAGATRAAAATLARGAEQVRQIRLALAEGAEQEKPRGERSSQVAHDTGEQTDRGRQLAEEHAEMEQRRRHQDGPSMGRG